VRVALLHLLAGLLGAVVRAGEMPAVRLVAAPVAPVAWRQVARRPPLVRPRRAAGAGRAVLGLAERRRPARATAVFRNQGALFRKSYGLVTDTSQNARRNRLTKVEPLDSDFANNRRFMSPFS
jgi:hypothetical protein